MVRVNLDDGEVRVLVGADEMRVVFLGIAVHGHLNFGGLVDYVIVGEDESLAVNDHA